MITFLQVAWSRRPQKSTALSQLKKIQGKNIYQASPPERNGRTKNRHENHNLNIYHHQCKDQFPSDAMNMNNCIDPFPYSRQKG